MQAVWYEKYGPAREVLTLGEAAAPDPGPGEVLVRVRASGVNPSDVKARAGARAGAGPMPWPRIIPHSDGAGVVEAVGAGVDRARIGERVWLWNGQWRRPFGTCAELIALPSAQAVPLPEAADFHAGACMGIPGATAHHCVFADGPVAGKTVLATGGAGKVARYAIRMASRAGARVIATASPAKAEIARAAGAELVLDHGAEGLAEQLLEATGGAGVDRVIEQEFGANIGWVAEALRVGGCIAAYGSAKAMAPTLPFYPLMFRNATLRMPLVYELNAAERRAVVDGVNALLVEGALDHLIAGVFPLAETAAAHELVETAAKPGCVIVEP